MVPSTTAYDELWKMIIEPDRMTYNIQSLGPADFTVNDKPIHRSDFKIQNGRGLFLECSFYQHVDSNGPRPCVVYLHGSGCSRLEGLRYYNVALRNGYNFFCFDFAGSGMSDGRYTSIGWFEQHDVEVVVEYLKQQGKTSKIALWGRSMGGVAAMFYAARMPRVDCLVLDSPYSKFNRLAKELVRRNATIPGFVTKGALGLLRNTILDIADFDLEDLVPIDYVPAIQAPILFGHGQDDDLVAAEQCYDLYNAAQGHKEMIIFAADHNSERPEKWHQTVANFLGRYLGKVGGNPGPRPQQQLLNIPGNIPRKQSVGAIRQPIPQVRQAQPTPIMVNGADLRTRKLTNPVFTSSVFNGPPPLVQNINSLTVRHTSSNPMMMSQQISHNGPVGPVLLKPEHHPIHTTRFLTPQPQQHIQSQPLLIPAPTVRELPRMVVPLQQQIPQMRVPVVSAPTPLVGFTHTNVPPIQISSSFPGSVNPVLINTPLSDLRSSRTRFYSHDVVYHM